MRACLACGLITLRKNGGEHRNDLKEMNIMAAEILLYPDYQKL